MWRGGEGGAEITAGPVNLCELMKRARWLSQQSAHTGSELRVCCFLLIRVFISVEKICSSDLLLAPVSVCSVQYPPPPSLLFPFQHYSHHLCWTSWSHCSADIQHLMAAGLSQRMYLALEALLISAVRLCSGVDFTFAQTGFKSNCVQLLWEKHSNGSKAVISLTEEKKKKAKNSPGPVSQLKPQSLSTVFPFKFIPLSDFHRDVFSFLCCCFFQLCGAKASHFEDCKLTVRPLSAAIY